MAYLSCRGFSKRKNIFMPKHKCAGAFTDETKLEKNLAFALRLCYHKKTKWLLRLYENNAVMKKVAIPCLWRREKPPLAENGFYRVRSVNLVRCCEVLFGAARLNLLVGGDGRPRYRPKECLLLAAKNWVVPRKRWLSSLLIGAKAFLLPKR